MAENGADFTRTFRALTFLPDSPGNDEPARRAFTDPTSFDAWAAHWRARVAGTDRSGMRLANPAYIPRNHRVEEAIRAGGAGDFGPFERLVEVLARPYDEQPGAEELQLAPEEHEAVRETFCGT
jgi:uncharacterized protein YdiU (UPF0061 family)